MTAPDDLVSEHGTVDARTLTGAGHGRRRKPTSETVDSPVGTYRPELQGLRAIAILMVVCYHIWFGRVSGGVDIFLLISAFLLTGSFTRKLESGAPLKVPAYWIHAFKRLLPPAAIVVLITLAGIAVILPSTRWRDLIGEAIASGLYYENWLLAARSVDYYAADHSTASPFQHFWSLSIQGQVFLLWPLLFALAAVIIRITGARPRPVLLILFGTITAASFAWSVYFTDTDQAFAYFDTRTRIWEFGLGSLFALILPSIERTIGYRDPQDPTANRAATLRALASWTGLVLVLSAGWVIDVEGAFPGYAALWPLLAAGLVIAAGPTRTRWGADRILSSRPLQWLGDISYALYLVHWPLLILTLVTTDTSYATPLTGTILIIASILTAWALTRFVDTPIRTSPRLKTTWWRGTLVITTSLALVLGPAVGWKVELDRRAAAIERAAIGNNPGARVLDPGYTAEIPREAPVAPDLATLPDDWFGTTDSCTEYLENLPADLEGCQMTQGAKPNAPILAIVGDSRDQQFAPALVAGAQAKGWTIVVVPLGGCAFTTGPGVEDWCRDHNERVSDLLMELDPEVIATSLTWVGHDFEEIPSPGVEKLLAPFLDRGTDVIGYRMYPRLPFSPTRCWEEAGMATSAETECTVEASTAEAPWPDIVNDVEAAGTLFMVDVRDRICPDGLCAPVIGNVYVWIDEAHPSRTYTETLAPVVEDQLREQGWIW